MIMAYCELSHQKGLSLLEILWRLFEVNLAIVYLWINFFIKDNSLKKLLPFLRNIH